MSEFSDLPADGMTPLTPNDPHSIGPYLTLGRLGSGGMGVVYLARRSHDDRLVAVKVLRPDLSDQRHFRLRFQREVRVAQRLVSDYTARCVDADTEGSLQWIATEFVPGPTLAERVEEAGSMPEERVRQLGVGLADALKSMHAAGLLHRDLKPNNVILSRAGPKLIDFGVCQDVEATSLTQVGVRLGSLAWMSPEQLVGHPATRAADAFSLGLLLAYGALGRHPYGKGRVDAVAYRVVHHEPDLSGLAPSLAPVIRRLLALDPQQRPTPDEVCASLGEDGTSTANTASISQTQQEMGGGDLPTLPEHSSGFTREVFVATNRTRRSLTALAASIGVVVAMAGAVVLGVISFPFSGSDSGAGSAGADLATTAPPTPASSPDQAGERTVSASCALFSSQALAQAWFDAYYPFYGDLLGLDTDGDRVACEDLEG